MNQALERYPGLSRASTAEKLAVADELWASIRSSGPIEMSPSHEIELERRRQAVLDNPALALDSATARAQFKRR